MADSIVHPASWLSFAGLLPIVEARFELREFVDIQGRERGPMIVSTLGWPRWEAFLRYAPVPMRTAREFRARCNRIGKTNMVQIGDPERLFPRLDPTGDNLGATTPKVTDRGGRTLRIYGLPPGYPLRWGDLFVVTYGSNPVRRCLLEVAEDINASGTGTTPVFEVSPFVPEGIVHGDPVTLKRPTALMYVTEYGYGSTFGTHTADMSITAVEGQAQSAP